MIEYQTKSSKLSPLDKPMLKKLMELKYNSEVEWLSSMHKAQESSPNITEEKTHRKKEKEMVVFCLFVLFFILFYSRHHHFLSWVNLL